MVADLINHLLGEAGAGIEHREDDSEDAERGVEIPLDQVQRFHEPAEPLEGHVFALDGDNHAVAGAQGVNGEQSE